MFILGAIFLTAVLQPATVSAHPNIRDDKGISQAWTPAGCFPMGASAAQTDISFADAHPQHEVCFAKGFWVDQYDVTNEAYQKFIDAGGYTHPEYWSDTGWRWLNANKITGPMNFAEFDAPLQPRVGVSWYEAEAYAKWRGGSLPTEAQWEYVARGPQGMSYPWGDKYVTGKANIDERPDGPAFLGRSSVVGSYAGDKSWVGAYDMAGNVWQWTADWYQNGYYNLKIRMDPQGPARGTLKVLRGGSWGYDEDCAASTYRFHTTPDMRSAAVGFRVVTVSDEN